mgnify:FL=1
MEDVMPNHREHSALKKRLAEIKEENSALRSTGHQNAALVARYRRLIENAPVGMYEIDFATGRCVWVNRFVLDFTGYSREEFMAMPMTDLLTDQSLEDFLERFEKIQHNEQVPTKVEFQVKIKDGRTFWVQFEIEFIWEAGVV